MAVTEAVKAENVTWVLTVPVCCSDPAKYFMRQAAIQGGFIKGGGDDDEVNSGEEDDRIDPTHVSGHVPQVHAVHPQIIALLWFRCLGDQAIFGIWVGPDL